MRYLFAAFLLLSLSGVAFAEEHGRGGGERHEEHRGGPAREFERHIWPEHRYPYHQRHWGCDPWGHCAWAYP